MAMTSRERVQRCLRFERPDRMPRELWYLPWAEAHYPETVRELKTRFRGDFTGPAGVGRPSPRVKGEAYAVGTHVDEWGCTFTNVQAGVIGEVKEPLLREAADWRDLKPPYETLPENPAAARDAVNRSCAASKDFVRAPCCPRPWERYQFIRTTQNAMLDVMEPDDGFRDLLRTIHEYYLKELEFWVRTDVDGVMFMDDWGSQKRLLIPPRLWREFFKPLYREYCQLAHAHKKPIFMHSDGCIQEVYADLVEVGVDALNSQLFCMDLPELARIAKGKLTFWGEIDRQHVLPGDDPGAARAAVRQVVEHLYRPDGGVIAQFELGPGARIENGDAIFQAWDEMTTGAGGLGRPDLG
jgi:uroporphyrinogen decarboxylase